MGIHHHTAKGTPKLNELQVGCGDNRWRARTAVSMEKGNENGLMRRIPFVGAWVVLAAFIAMNFQPTMGWCAELPRDGEPERDGLATAIVSAAGSNGQDHAPLQPVASTKMASHIDELLAAHWKKSGVELAPPTTDTEFLRRIYLDLTGRIPSVSEVYDFDDDTQQDRRVRLVDQLLSHRDHATHLATVWRRFLLPDGVDLSRYGGTSGLEQWLVDRFAANVPYDQIVRELLQAEGRVTKSGPILFYAALKLSPEEIASQSARAFLGTRMECAQCHDHPFDDRWSQHDFWSYAAFFARISRPQGKLETVSSVMRVRDSDRGDVTLPETDEVVPPRFPKGELLDEQSGSRSRRAELAEWLTRDNNQQLARATVNRVWAQMFGLGIVEPVDDMRPDNPPKCPEVLDELTEYFVQTDFDLKNLLRTLVLTDAYQLSSRAATDDPERRANFAQMSIKSFTAEQLYDCIAMATRMQATQTSLNGEESLMRFDNSSRRAFLEQFRAPPGQPTEYHAGIPQALTLMNGGLVHSATDVSQSGLLNSMPPFFRDQQRIETLFLATLSRRPSDKEVSTMLGYVKSAGSDEEKQETFGNILWALLNSAEFTLNH